MLFTLTYGDEDDDNQTVYATETMIRDILPLASAAGIITWSVTDETGRDVTHLFN